MAAATTQTAGRFSKGIEQLPDAPEKRTIGRFSRGCEHAR
jgi:hypothetical protein